ncbi:MAG: magnesium transporter, partial [Thermoplasmata archaeon]|nr:magnesium transporter [Thermoplasmata archaeon]
MVPAWNIQRPIRPTQLLAVCLAAPLAIFRHSLLSDIGKILRQSAFALLICAFTGMAAGIFLGSMANTLQLLPGLIILIPGAMALRGDIFASMGARLGTYLHTGQISRSREHSPVLRENVLSSIAQTLVLSLALGLLAAGVASLVGIDVISPAAFIVISVLAGLLAAALLPIITFAVSMGSFKRGWDPDNVTAPLITASGDMIAIPAVFLAAHVVLYIETVEGVFIDMIAMAL